MFAYEKLPGLPRERILDAIAPVLHAHGLSGVELVWRTDSQGRVLYLTVENAEAAAAEVASAVGSGEAGAPPPSASTQGVTLDVCSRVSRDLSTAFDVLGLFDGQYRLEVGSPGLERRLYSLADYQRFRGRLAKLKLAVPLGGQSVLTGRLGGVDGAGRVLVAHDHESGTTAGAEGEQLEGLVAVAFEEIRSGQLVIDWEGMGFAPAPRPRAGRRSAAQGRK